jgi:hypothetical protein
MSAILRQFDPSAVPNTEVSVWLRPSCDSSRIMATGLSDATQARERLPGLTQLRARQALRAHYAPFTHGMMSLEYASMVSYIVASSMPMK